ncbi:PEP-CTERM sorting domain-containing protein [Haloferula chungangensis]|uniref:PEP-CTERM sorting domain-containing protein n=1 Tax=Haloferula chungangensis TaxID=1048331 RepID=A0ABW2L441_9BACT
MKVRTALVTLLGSALSANAAFVYVGTDLVLGDGSGITYTVTGDVGTNPQNNGGADDLRFLVNNGGSFTITFSSAVDLKIFNSEVSQGVNFDANPTTANSAVITANSGTAWGYTAGVYDLTDGSVDPAAGPSALSGLGTNVLTIASTRGYFTGAGIASSGAPSSETDWGEIAVSGVTSITYEFTNETNYDGFRIDAVAVPEPSVAVLAGLGLFGLGLRRRR